jgi:hypothetical protein
LPAVQPDGLCATAPALTLTTPPGRIAGCRFAPPSLERRRPIGRCTAAGSVVRPGSQRYRAVQGDRLPTLQHRAFFLGLVLPGNSTLVVWHLNPHCAGELSSPCRAINANLRFQCYCSHAFLCSHYGIPLLQALGPAEMPASHTLGGRHGFNLLVPLEICRCASSWDRLSESIPLEPVGKRKGQVFTFRLPRPW